MRLLCDFAQQVCQGDNANGLALAIDHIHTVQVVLHYAVNDLQPQLYSQKRIIIATTEQCVHVAACRLAPKAGSQQCAYVVMPKVAVCIRSESTTMQAQHCETARIRTRTVILMCDNTIVILCAVLFLRSEANSYPTNESHAGVVTLQTLARSPGGNSQWRKYLAECM